MRLLKVLLCCVLSGCAFHSAPRKIKIKGSDTVLPVAQALTEHFLAKAPNFTIAVTGGGSGVGIMALTARTTDIAMASRKIKFHEKFQLKLKNIPYKTLIIAYDALAVCVNPKNPVKQLTREELEGIFTGKITNWKEVGGPDLKIIAYSRESSSGTFEFFKDHVMNGNEYAEKILMLPATGAVVQSVSQTPGAIGYIGLAYLNSQVKALAVSYDQGKNYYEPTMENAASGKYPVVRPLFFYYPTDLEPKLKPFLNFVTSPEGKQIIKHVGYVPPETPSS